MSPYDDIFEKISGLLSVQRKTEIPKILQKGKSKQDIKKLHNDQFHKSKIIKWQIRNVLAKMITSFKASSKTVKGRIFGEKSSINSRNFLTS